MRNKLTLKACQVNKESAIYQNHQNEMKSNIWNVMMGQSPYPVWYIFLRGLCICYIIIEMTCLYRCLLAPLHTLLDDVVVQSDAVYSIPRELKTTECDFSILDRWALFMLVAASSPADDNHHSKVSTRKCIQDTLEVLHRRSLTLVTRHFLSYRIRGLFLNTW